MSLWIAHCVLREERFQHIISFGDREYLDDLDQTVNDLREEDTKDLHRILASWDFKDDFDDEN
jgi:hypothetical protein